MTKRSVAILFFLLALFPGVASAQMDMLPFMFRDIPKEYETGIPGKMTFQEFEQLNRSVDFFTIGMSMIWPGYASAEVGRTGQAVALGGLRWGTFGMMGYAVWDQWQGWKNIWETGDLSAWEYDQVKQNMTLFVAGGMANMALWCADVLLAYHQARDDRNRVIYQYGLEVTVAAEGLPEHERLRRMAVQDDPKLRASTLAELTRRLARWTTPADFGEFSWYAGKLFARDGRPEQAVAVLTRGLALAAESPFAFRSQSLVLQLIDDNRKAWGTDAELLVPSSSPATVDPLGYLSALPSFTNLPLRRAFLVLADEYLQTGGRPEAGDQVLNKMAAAWALEPDTKSRMAALSKLLLFYPESPLADEAQATLQTLQTPVTLPTR